MFWWGAQAGASHAFRDLESSGRSNLWPHVMVSISVFSQNIFLIDSIYFNRKTWSESWLFIHLGRAETPFPLHKLWKSSVLQPENEDQRLIGRCIVSMESEDENPSRNQLMFSLVSESVCCSAWFNVMLKNTNFSRDATESCHAGSRAATKL